MIKLKELLRKLKKEINLDSNLLIELLILIIISLLCFYNGYLRGISKERINTLKIQKQYEESIEYCEKYHYVLYHYGEHGYEVEEKQ